MAKRKYKEDSDFQEFVRKFGKRLYRNLRKSDSLDSALYIAFTEGYLVGGKSAAEYMGKVLSHDTEGNWNPFYIS